jgi:hypothetical protein
MINAFSSIGDISLSGRINANSSIQFVRSLVGDVNDLDILETLNA